MKRSRFTEEQIIAILREQEAGAKTGEVCRQPGISEATFSAWKAKFGGLEVSEARRLKALEAENTKLKKLLADAMLDNVALKDRLAKKGSLPPPSERPSLIFVDLTRGASGGRVPRSRWTGARSGLAAGDRMTGRCAGGCARWPPRAGGSAIDACPYCCAGRGWSSIASEPSASTARTSSP